MMVRENLMWDRFSFEVHNCIYTRENDYKVLHKKQDIRRKNNGKMGALVNQQQTNEPTLQEQEGQQPKPGF